jgi:DNA mismatch repair protein MutS
VKPAKRGKEPPLQVSLFGQKSPVIEELAKLDINSLTPLEALTKLYELQKRVGEGERGG